MIPHIPSLQDPVLAAALQAKINGKTKPLGALGQLEALMLKLGLILGSETPSLREPQLMVFAGDHGVARFAFETGAVVATCDCTACGCRCSRPGKNR